MGDPNLPPGSGPISEQSPQDERPHHVSGQVQVWNCPDSAEAYDIIASRNPTHRKVFLWMRGELKKRGPFDRIMDVGGGTGLFAQSLREDDILTPVTLIDPGEDGTTAIAMKKQIHAVEIVPKRFDMYQITRKPEGEKIIVVASYVLHNFTPEGRRLFFYWLNNNLQKGEMFILGDTVADEPIGSQIRETRRDLFGKAVGAEYWRDDDSIPASLREKILHHTLNEDIHTVPDFDEYMRLAIDYGFSMESVHQEGYLRMIVFKKC